MNCKQGDLAVVVRSDSGNEGAVVQCLRLYIGPMQTPAGRITEPRAAWLIDRPLPGRLSGRECWHVEDRKLRPLRGSDGQDEMLRLVGLPAGTPQAA